MATSASLTFPTTLQLKNLADPTDAQDAATKNYVDAQKVDPTKIANGTSNVAITTTNGNVTVGVGGVDTVLTVTPTGTVVKGSENVTGNLTTSGNLLAGLPGTNVYLGNVANIKVYGGSTGQFLKLTSASASTVVTAQIQTTDTTITVANTNGFPSSGYIIVENEVISYSGVTAYTFTGCVRGQFNSTIAGHTTSATVYSYNGGTVGWAPLDSSQIFNGTSNVVVGLNGPVTVGVAGTPAVATFNSTGVNIAGYANINSGTITTSTPVSVVQTWNNPSTTFTGIYENITDSGSTQTSKLLDLQVGGTSKFIVDKGGNVTVGSGSGGSLSGLYGMTMNNITINGAVAGNSNVSTVTGNLGLRLLSSTYTDSVALASSTIANAAIHAIDQPTLAASSTGVTFTNASTLYIANVPVAGTNATLTNKYALYIGNGNSYFNGNITSTNQLISTVATGTAPLNVTSNTVVTNLHANLSDYSTITTSVTGTNYLTFVSGSTSSSYPLLSNSALSFNSLNGTLFSTNVNVTSQLISTVATGTAPLLINSTTKVANLYANVSDYSTMTVATTGTYYPTFVSSSTTGAQQEYVASGISFNAATSNLAASILYASGQLISGVATGTAPLNVTSTTVVTNLHANLSDYSTVTATTTGTYYPTFVSGATTGAYAEAVTAGINFNAATNNLSTTTLTASGQLVSTVAIGTAPLNVTSTTVVTNLHANLSDYSTVTASTATALYPTFVSATTTGAYAKSVAAGINFNATTNTLATTNVSASGQLVSTVATGTAPLSITSTTRVTNLNVAYANVSDYGAVTTQTTGTFYPVFVSGSTTGNYAHASNTNLSFNAATGQLNATLLNATDLTLSGNLTVSGTTTTINATTTRLVDPIMELGGGSGGAALTATDNKDRGLLLHYFGTVATDAFIGYKASSSEFIVANSVTTAGEVVTVSTYGNLRANNFIGTIAAGSNAITTTGTITGGTIVGIFAAGANNISTTGNISGGNLIGPHANGTSNVNIPTSGGNVVVGVGGTASVVTITTTGINVAGYANLGSGVLSTTGNANVGNLGFGTGVITGTGNITGGNLIGSHANGTSNVNIPTSGGNVVVGVGGSGSIVTITSSGINVAGYANLGSGAFTTTGNANANNFNATTQFVSTVATGTAPLSVASTTRVTNLNVAYSNVSDYSNITAQTTGTYYPVFASGSTAANYQLAANTNINVAISTGVVSATGFTATGNITGGNLIGPYANGTSNINITSGANIQAVVGSAIIANISSSGITVTGNLNINSGTLSGATSYPVINATQTWNNASTVFTGIYANITDTFSAVTSKLIDLQVSGASKFSVDKGGNITATSYNGLFANGTSYLGIVNNSNVYSAVNGVTVLNVGSTGATVTGNLYANAANLSTGTLTSSTPALNVTQTWNSGTTIFTGIYTNIVDTQSSSSSLLIDLQVGGVSKFKVDKAGVITASAINLPSFNFTSTQGTTPFVVLSTTKVANLNADYLDGYDSSVTNLANTVVVRDPLGNIAGGNITGIIATATQPQITSLGSLTGLTVSSATGIVNFITTANVSLGAIANLHITGGSTGQVLSTDGSGGLSWATVPSATFYVGTTSLTTTRTSAAQALTGITSIDGSAAKLTTPRLINGVAFDGSADITVPLPTTGAITSANITTTGFANVGTTLTVNGISTLQGVAEVLTSPAVGTYNLNTGTIFYHASGAVTGNFTAAFTNVPAVGAGLSRVVTATIVVAQGASVGIPSAVSVNGAGQTIRWFGGAIPTTTPSNLDYFTFSIFVVSGSVVQVTGTYATYN